MQIGGIKLFLQTFVTLVIFRIRTIIIVKEVLLALVFFHFRPRLVSRLGFILKEVVTVPNSPLYIFCAVEQEFLRALVLPFWGVHQSILILIGIQILLSLTHFSVLSQIFGDFFPRFFNFFARKKASLIPGNVYFSVLISNRIVGANLDIFLP